MTSAAKFGPKVVEYSSPHHHVYKRVVDLGCFEKTYYVTDFGERAGIIVAGPQGILLTRQYRHLIDRLSWEVPGGKCEAGEEPAAAAIRECQEEAGLLCSNLRPLLQYQPGLDTLHNPTHVFHTDCFSEIPEHTADVKEVASTSFLPLERCLAMIGSGEIIDSLSIIALLSYSTFVQRQAS